MRPRRGRGMELTRSREVGLPPPRCSGGQGGSRRDHLRLALVGGGLVLSVLVLKQFLGLFLGGISHHTPTPGTEAVEDLALLLIFAGCFHLYSSKVVREREALERELTGALALAEAERAKVTALNDELMLQAAELNLANRELEAFCAAVCHDLRAPLTRIYSASQALGEHAPGLDRDGLFFLSNITGGALQMEALIESLLVLSQASEVEMTRSRVDLSRLASDVAAKLALQEPARSVQFRVAPELTVWADPQLMYIALENLIGNAWKYTGNCEVARIELGVEPGCNGEPVYFLKDNGAGFDMEQADRLFEPFRRLHRHQDFPGTGVGLATVKRIMRRHQGRIWGEGEAGRGATFYFSFGLPDPERVAPAPAFVL